MLSCSRAPSINIARFNAREVFGSFEIFDCCTDATQTEARMKPIIAIPATLLLVYRAYSKKSLTPGGILAAALTAIAHAIHPWNLPFVLLVVFFLAGTRATHVSWPFPVPMSVPAHGHG